MLLSHGDQKQKQYYEWIMVQGKFNKLKKLFLKNDGNIFILMKNISKLNKYIGKKNLNNFINKWVLIVH